MVMIDSVGSRSIEFDVIRFGFLILNGGAVGCRFGEVEVGARRKVRPVVYSGIDVRRMLERTAGGGRCSRAAAAGVIY